MYFGRMSNVHQDRLNRILAMLNEGGDQTFLLFAAAKEYEALGDIEAAINHYHRVLTLDKSYIGAYYHLAAAYQQDGQPARATETAHAGILLAQSLGDSKNESELVQLVASF